MWARPTIQRRVLRFAWRIIRILIIAAAAAGPVPPPPPPPPVAVQEEPDPGGQLLEHDD
jgi:hypothetical protein